MADKTWQEIVALAEHYRAVGIVEHNLFNQPLLAYPWEHLTGLSTSGTHRLDIDTSIWFTAIEPSSGMTFKWSIHTEKREANGRSVYMIDEHLVVAVSGLIKDEVLNDVWHCYLRDVAEAVRSRANSAMEEVLAMYGASGTLEKLSGKF